MIYDYEREGASMRDNFGTTADTSQVELDRWDTDGGMCGCNEHTAARRNMHSHVSLFDVAVAPAMTPLDCDSKELRARIIEMRAELGTMGRAFYVLQGEIAALRADVRRELGK